MKKYLLSLVMLGSAFGASAQITVISSQLQMAVSPDTAHYRLIDNAVAVPTEGANQLWDYSAAMPGTAMFSSLLPSDTANGFLNTTGMFTYNVGLGPLVLSGSKAYRTQSALGIYNAGFTTAEQTINLGPITTDPNDSLYFPLSSNNFGTSVSIYEFPLADMANYSGTYEAITPFELTVSSASLAQTPGEMIQSVSYSDSVAGWGKVIMPGGDTLEVLLIKHSEVWVDSIFIGGAPAPQMMLSMFGLTQGTVTTSNYYDFVAQGLERSAMRIYTDETFTNYVDGEYSTEEPVILNSIAKFSKTALNVYPNPAKTGVRIELSGVSGNVQAEIFSVDGKSVATHTLNNDGTGANLSLEGLNNGAYMVKVSGDNNFVGYFRVVKAN